MYSISWMMRTKEKNRKQLEIESRIVRYILSKGMITLLHISEQRLEKAGD